MASNLKEKIRDVVFWICAGGAIYLIVAFLMKTDWLSSPKKLSELYEIIRDTLTLMAYFLAPAAAFVLFSDWRMEHIEKTREQQGSDIYNLFLNINSDFVELNIEMQEEESFSEEGRVLIEQMQKNLLGQLYRLDRLIAEFDFDDLDSKKFQALSKQMIYQLFEMFSYQGFMFSSLLKVNNPEEFMGEYENESAEEFAEVYQEKFEQDYNNYNESSSKLYDLSEQMKLLKDALKVKVKSPN